LQTWKTFIRNHMEGIASIDLFVVPTIAFQQLFAFLVLGHGRRRLLWFAVTCNPTAEWLARQITETFPWDSAPKYLIRDNDRSVFWFAASSLVRCRPKWITELSQDCIPQPNGVALASTRGFDGEVCYHLHDWIGAVDQLFGP
jgi:hypothetical protein